MAPRPRIRGTRSPSLRRLGVVGGLLLTSTFAGAAQRGGPTTPTRAPTPEEIAELNDLFNDVERFQGISNEFRATAKEVVRISYKKKTKEINGKYEPQIASSEKEGKTRRRDAIAMFEAFLQKYPHDKRWTPDALFRLAELYYEKSAEDFLDADEAYKVALDGPTPPTTPPPRVNYAETINRYKRLLTEFPNYRFLDATYYLLGFCLGEMGQEAEAKQALLALVCSNKYRPIDAPQPAPPASAGDPYKECVAVKADSKFIPEAWTRVGEFHFDATNELHLAIAAFKKVLEVKDSPYYDRALYKLAWAYYRDNHFPEAIREFDNLVVYADKRKASGQKVGSDLRPEAVQYLGVSFSEPDWNGDTLPDAETGMQRADAFYKGRESEPHVREVYQRIGDIFFDSTKYNDAIAVYKALLQKWPTYEDAPVVQDKIVRAYEKDRNLIAAAKEREELGRNYSKGSDWYKKNQDKPEALAVAAQLAEDALLTAATNVHSQAQACKGKLGSAPTAQAIDQCKTLYRTAGELYEKYLAAYPNSKRTYEFSAYYADALYYSGQLEKAIVAYITVRDSVLDNKYMADSALRIIKAYEEVIEQMKVAKQLDDPPIPDEKNTKPPIAAIPMPEIYQKYIAAIDWYIANLKDERTADLRYANAVLSLRYRQWSEARDRLGAITKDYCGSKPEVGFKAYDAILQTYFIDYNVDDEQAKDCALGKLLTVAEQFSDSPCGKHEKAKPYLSRFDQLKASVKTMIITKRLQIAMENEEKGTNKQLVMCESEMGGIAVVTGATKGAGGAKTSADLDVGLALDLIDVVNGNPKDSGAPTALNNACVIYEKLYQFGEATKCYERLAKDYGDTEWGKEALWNASRNHYRFFEFDQAVKGYLTVAEDSRFAKSEHRKEALGLAATLLDNDQQYMKAADLYKRYAEAISDKPADSAQAYYFACGAYEKAREINKQNSCLKDFIKRYDKKAEAGEYVVQSYMKLAVNVEATSKDRKAVIAAYKKVRDEFIARKLPPATEAAGFAAKADFLIEEEKFKTFQGKELKFAGKPEQIKKTFDSFTAEAKQLNDEYIKILEYKYATWTLAALLRSGDIYYEFAQKLIKAANNPPEDVKKLAKMACKANPDDCGLVEGQYKDGIYTFVTPVEDTAKNKWKDTLARATQLGVTNDYVKKARENLSKYLPDEFPFIKDERIALETP